MTAVRDAGPVRDGTDVWFRCHRVAREEGLAPALRLLGSAVPDGFPPCGPAGHAVLPAGDGDARFDLPGGPVVVLRGAGPGPAGVERDTWALGLVWLRLGLSEGLREECLHYLRNRRAGDSVLVQQQLVKGALAEVTAAHLEVRAVLAGAGPGDLVPAALDDLHTRITLADRAQLKLLGASSMLLGGAGEVAYVSELVADAYRAEEHR